MSKKHKLTDVSEPSPAIRLNPFLWKSFEALCRRGDAPDPSKTFSLAHVDNFRHCHGANPILSTANSGGGSGSGSGPHALLHVPATTAAKPKEQQHQQQSQQVWALPLRMPDLLWMTFITTLITEAQDRH